MKKIMMLCMVFIMMLSLVACEGDGVINGMSLEGLNLKGDVASVKTEMFSGFSRKAVNEVFFDMGYMYSGNREIVFNENGLVDRYSDFTKDGQLQHEQYFFYDDLDRIDQLTSNYYAFGELSSEEITEFDKIDGVLNIEDNTLKSKIINGETEEVLGYLTYELDDQGRYIKSSYHDDGVSKEVYNSIEYNEFGYISNTKYYDDDTIMSETSLEYDESFNMIKVVMTRASEVIEYTIEYTFDDQENWIEQKIFRGEDHKYTIKRTIDYRK